MIRLGLTIYLLCLCFTNGPLLALTHCGIADVTAQCISGNWEAHIGRPNSYFWWPNIDMVTGRPCDNEGESANNLKWDYAYSDDGWSSCNYSVLDNQNNVIGFIQIGTDFYIPDGDNWKTESDRRLLICRSGYDDCLFQEPRRHYLPR